MWILKFTIESEKDMLLSPVLKKHNMSAQVYPLNFAQEHNGYSVTCCLKVFGPNTNQITRELQMDDRTINVEFTKKKVGFLQFRTTPMLKYLYEPGIFSYKPITIDNDGLNTYHIASFSKDRLKKIVESVKHTNLKVNVLKFCKKDLDELQFVNVFPSLSDKQSTAFDLAVKNGYYAYPRKTDGKNLASLMGISLPTYLFHLRNAEKKLLPGKSKS